MDQLKILFSDNLKSGKLYSDLRSFLENETDGANDVRYSEMLDYEHIDMLRESIPFNNICLIYTNYLYKSHFVRTYEKKKKIITEASTHYKDTDFTYSEDEFSILDMNPYSLALILLIVDSNYLEDQYKGEENNITYKIKRLREKYGSVRIICIFIGVREFLNIIDYTKHPQIFYDKNDNIIFNNKHLDRFIASLLIQYNVDTVEIENSTDIHKYIFKCCKYLHQSKIRKLNSYFKVKPAGIMSQFKNDNLNENKMYYTWVSQLMQITGISQDIAIRIAEEFNTPYDLIVHFKKINDEECLKDLIISSAYGERKLGKALSRKIYRIFSPNSNPYNAVS
ncbi:conserved Plasmodium protein, unknown function [Plasmodium chabaudi adami]|uniref:Uncharacterized protein n=1 Tax=Plasmodium chabaudi adami TaxID=5826 RepID=A0A1C6YFP2_PLACE|nr:conserved Plasmodium protein, unknown function [Plasmodium chabaudi adami]SCN60921.1 conserved Plasmodium protein, unknown function [Plasmodium chabaudi adami]